MSERGRRADAHARLTAPSGVAGRATANEFGQAVVELALVLPVIFVLLMLLVEGGIVARDQVMVVHAAREAARHAAVDASSSAAVDAAVAASGLAPLEVTITGREGAGSRVTARVRYRETARLPLIGSVAAHLTLEASATMRVETDP